MSAVCSCGQSSHHVIASRRTLDGKRVDLWSDGTLSTFMTSAIVARRLSRVASWLVMGEVCLYHADEVPALVAAARWAAQRDGLPGTMRARLHAPPRLRPVWTVIETDRDGRPRVQCWKLPRLRWPGLAVWRDAGRYSVWTEVGRTGTYEPTGCEFTNLRALGAYLESINP